MADFPMLRMAVVHALSSHSEFRNVSSLRQVRHALKSLRSISPLVRSLVNASSLAHETREITDLIRKYASNKLSNPEKRFFQSHGRMLEDWISRFGELAEDRPEFVSRTLAGNPILSDRQRKTVRDFLRRARGVFPSTEFMVTDHSGVSGILAGKGRKKPGPLQVRTLLTENANDFEKIEAIYKDAILLDPRLVKDLWPEFHNWMPPLLFSLSLRNRNSPFSFDHFHDLLEYALAYHHREARRVARVPLPAQFRLADSDLSKLAALLLGPHSRIIDPKFSWFIKELATSELSRTTFLKTWPRFVFPKTRNSS